MADERGGHLGLHLVAPIGNTEPDYCTYVVGLYFHTIVYQYRIGESARMSKRLIEHHHEVIFEIVWHTAAVARGITDDGILLGDDFYIRPFVESVDDHKCAIRLRERETEPCCPFGGRDFGGHVVDSEVHTVIVWLRHFGLM